MKSVHQHTVFKIRVCLLTFTKMKLQAAEKTINFSQYWNGNDQNQRCDGLQLRRPANITNVNVSAKLTIFQV